MHPMPTERLFLKAGWQEPKGRSIVQPRSRLGRREAKNLPPSHRRTGKNRFTFIYDELEAEEPVTWSYLLHTVTNPMNVNMVNGFVHVQATSKNGISTPTYWAVMN